eukprot:TRINITY_DN810_c1_g1_i2.p1 TRINITY_DN810_c1_g1~~TRINITY_DN810_c1_g1_i2.p1  ORF type:complete len:1420 (-),score=582.95 TRINITY_DN810_c1_g1_i2:217-4476(-)
MEIDMASHEEEALQTFFRNVEDPSEIYKLSEKLYGMKEFQLLYECSEHAHLRINVVEEERQKNQKRLEQINNRLQQIEKLIKDDGNLPAYQKEKRELNMETVILNALPLYCKQDASANHGLKFSFAKLVINSALDTKKQRQKENPNLSESVLDEEVAKTIQSNLAQLVYEHVAESAQLLASGHVYPTALTTWKAAQERVGLLQQNFSSEYKLLIERNTLRVLEETLAKIKTRLPAPLQKRYDELNALEASGTLNFDTKGSIVDRRSFRKYDEFTLQTALAILRCISTQIAENKELRNQDRMKELKEITAKEVIAYFISGTDEREPYMRNPFQLLELANSAFHIDMQLVLGIGAQIKARIEELHQDRVERNNLRVELQQINKEAADSAVQWRTISVEQMQRAITLEVEIKIGESMDYQQHGDHKTLLFDTYKLMMTAIFDMTATTKKVNIELLIKEIEDPHLLSMLAEFAQSKVESDVVLMCGERCQSLIQEIDGLRLVRRPLQTQLDNLKSEESRLAAKHIHLDEAKAKKMEELKQEIADLPKFPEFADVYNLHQYDEMSLQIVQVMTNAILDSKVDYEKKVQHMFKTMHPESIDKKKISRDRKELEARIAELVQTCLEKFTNPDYLRKFAESMQKRGEVDITIKVGFKALKCIEGIEEQRSVRKPIEDQIAALEQEKRTLSQLKRNLEKDKEAELTKLNEQLEALPQWPHFARSQDVAQYHELKLDMLKIMLYTLIDGENDYDAKIKQQRFENPNSINEKRIAADKARFRVDLENVLNLTKQTLLDPDQLINLSRDMSNYKNHRSDIAFSLASDIYSKIRNLEEGRFQRDLIRMQIQILEEEKAELAERKKTLSKEQLAKIQEFNKELKQLDCPSYVGTANQHNAKLNQLSQILLDTVMNNLSARQEKMQPVLEMILEYTIDPTFLLSTIKTLRDAKMFPQTVSMELKCQELLLNLKETALVRIDNEKIRETLQKEKASLERKRQTLSEEDAEGLAICKLEDKCFQLLPEFSKYPNYDGLFLELAENRIRTAIAERESFKQHITSEENNLTADEISQKTQELEELVSSVTTDVMTYVTSIENGIKLAKSMRDKTEHALVVQIGLNIEEKIQAQRDLLTAYEELKEGFSKTEQQILQLSLDQSKKSAKRRENLEIQLENFKIQLEEAAKSDFTVEQINEFTLEITEIVAKSANIENQEQVLRDQHILAFKVDPKQERWDDIRNLTSDEDEWQELKESLVQYLMKREGENATQKIELLLKDELFDQCIEIFPSPTGEEEELELFEKLWTAVDQADPSKLGNLLPLLTKFMKRYFQTFQFDKIDPIMDKVQRRYPAIIADLYSQAFDLTMLNVLITQYPIVVQGIKDFKKRLRTLGLINTAWPQFFTQFKRKHKGKKEIAPNGGISRRILLGHSIHDGTKT